MVAKSIKNSSLYNILKNKRGDGIATILLFLVVIIFLTGYVGRVAGIITIQAQRTKINEALEVSVASATTEVSTDFENLKRLSRGYLLDYEIGIKSNIVKLDTEKAMSTFLTQLNNNMGGELGDIEENKRKENTAIVMAIITPQLDGKYAVDMCKLVGADISEAINNEIEFSIINEDAQNIPEVEEKIENRIGSEFELHLTDDGIFIAVVKNSAAFLAVITDYPVDAFFSSTTITAYDIGNARIIRKHEESGG